MLCIRCHISQITWITFGHTAPHSLQQQQQQKAVYSALWCARLVEKRRSFSCAHTLSLLLHNVWCCGGYFSLQTHSFRPLSFALFFLRLRARRFLFHLHQQHRAYKAGAVRIIWAGRSTSLSSSFLFLTAKVILYQTLIQIENGMAASFPSRAAFS